MRWYEIVSRKFHQDGEGDGEQIFYLWEKDILKALGRVKELPGMPRHSSYSLRRLSDDESFVLEEDICMKGGVSLEEAKRRYFGYDSRGSERARV